MVQGRDEVAWAHIRAVEELASVRNPQIQAPVSVAAATLMLREGRYAEARDLAGRLPGNPHDPDMFALYLAQAVIEAEAYLAGDADAVARLDAVVARVSDLEAEMRHGLIRNRLQAVLALVRAERTRCSDAADPGAWRTAIEVAQRRTTAHVLARTRVRLVEALILAGDREKARAELALAHRITAELGAIPLREGLEQLASRSRIPLPGVATSAADPSSGLTARELEVLALLAEGRTNREIGEALFISPKTASVHVSNLLMKLGAANRTEAANQARERGLLPQT